MVYVLNKYIHTYVQICTHEAKFPCGENMPDGKATRQRIEEHTSPRGPVENHSKGLSESKSASPWNPAENHSGVAQCAIVSSHNTSEHNIVNYFITVVDSEG